MQYMQGELEMNGKTSRRAVCAERCKHGSGRGERKSVKGQLAGRLLHYTPSGHAFTNLQLAVSRRWTREDGQMQEKTNWFNVTLWRRQAEVASQYLSKGNRVLIVGEIDGARSYTDREGNPRAAIDITGHSFRILESRANGHDSEQTAPEVETATDAAEEPLPF